MSDKPATATWKAWLLAIGVVLGVIAAFAGLQTVRYTSSDAFCAQACHNSHPHATATWIQSAHYSNQRGIVTHCTDCHLPPGGIDYLTEKARLGFNDVYSQVFHDVSKIDWAEKRQLAHARTFSFDKSCLHCHSNLFGDGLARVHDALPAAPQQATPEQVREMRIIARRMEAHLYYQRNRTTMRCINCHLFEGHKIPSTTEPRLPVVETADFPLAPGGFHSYTESVPGSDIKLHLIAVPGGTLAMGSPTLGRCRQTDAGPIHDASVSSFWMTQGVVSRRDLDSFLAQHKAQPSATASARAHVEPANDEPLAMAFANWISQSTGRKYRLPSETELEFACIAGGTMPAWKRTDTRAHPDASANIAILNAWGFMDLPSERIELTLENSKQSRFSDPNSNHDEVVFRLVREPEANTNSAGNPANSGPSSTTIRNSPSPDSAAGSSGKGSSSGKGRG